VSIRTTPPGRHRIGRLAVASVPGRSACCTRVSTMRAPERARMASGDARWAAGSGTVISEASAEEIAI
jgi:hypothetical protein